MAPTLPYPVRKGRIDEDGFLVSVESSLSLMHPMPDEEHGGVRSRDRHSRHSSTHYVYPDPIPQEDDPLKGFWTWNDTSDEAEQQVRPTLSTEMPEIRENGRLVNDGHERMNTHIVVRPAETLTNTSDQPAYPSEARSSAANDQASAPNDSTPTYSQRHRRTAANRSSSTPLLQQFQRRSALHGPRNDLSITSSAGKTPSQLVQSSQDPKIDANGSQASSPYPMVAPNSVSMHSGTLDSPQTVSNPKLPATGHWSLPDATSQAQGAFSLTQRNYMPFGAFQASDSALNSSSVPRLPSGGDDNNNNNDNNNANTTSASNAANANPASFLPIAYSTQPLQHQTSFPYLSAQRSPNR